MRIVFVIRDYVAHHAEMEMTTLLPIDGGFMSLASRFVDPAFGCAVGWNYFIISAATLNYKITITNVVLGYWIDDLNPAIVISALLAFYFLLNAWNVKWFGEVELLGRSRRSSMIVADSLAGSPRARSCSSLVLPSSPSLPCAAGIPLSAIFSVMLSALTCASTTNMVSAIGMTPPHG